MINLLLIIKKNYKTILWALLGILLVFLVRCFHSHYDTIITKTARPPLEDVSARSKTILGVEAKTSKDDNDLEIKQKYVATVNNEKVEVPLKTVEAANDGYKAVVVQEVDMTKLVNTVVEVDRKNTEAKLKRNWEISTGFGIHQGDNFIPIELQRNFSNNNAISFELHQSTDLRSTKGWEIKYTWKF